MSKEIHANISQINAQTVGLSPSIAMGNLYQAAGHALGQAMLNCTNAQQNGNLVAEAIGTAGSKIILALAK
ncbi:MAG: RebB family R body protein [Salibacteraceae bacterium]